MTEIEALRILGEWLASFGETWSELAAIGAVLVVGVFAGLALAAREERRAERHESTLWTYTDEVEP